MMRAEACPVALSLRTDSSVRWDEATGYVHFIFMAVDLVFHQAPGVRVRQGGEFSWVPPTGPEGVLRPDFYHATLLTASREGAAPHETRALVSACQNYWQSLASVPTHVTFGLPPWKNSWNFGLNPEFHDLLHGVRTDLALLVRLHGWSANEADWREFHVSWN